MTITEMIESLEAIRESEGDIQVLVYIPYVGGYPKLSSNVDVDCRNDESGERSVVIEG